MSSGFNQKAIIVTGAGSGVGKALSLELAARGAIVYVTALTLEEAQSVVQVIQANGHNAIAVKVDVTVNEELQKIITKVVVEQGQLDVMINNAGLLYCGEFFDIKEEFLDKLIQVNLTAVTIGSLYAYRQMIKQGHGQILNISSMGGFVPAATMAVYAGTKHGVLGFTNTLATEAKEFGIRVQAACMGNIESNLLANAEDVHAGVTTFGSILPKPYPTEKAAKAIIDGLEKHKHPIFTPFYAALVWRLVRFFPGLLMKGSTDTMSKYRKLVK